MAKRATGMNLAAPERSNRQALHIAHSGRPLLLDLFCGGGGAAMGYYHAGFDVLGVDVYPQPNYPFPFIQADALMFPTDGFVAVHASPPCQRFSTLTLGAGTAGDYPDALGPIRERLKEAGLPYVIENVVGAPMINPVLICGTAMGLGSDDYRIRRHRLFETNWTVLVPPCACPGDRRRVMDITGSSSPSAPLIRRDGRIRSYRGSANESRVIMEMPWATRHEIAEAVPPRYTELIGRQLYARVIG